MVLVFMNCEKNYLKALVKNKKKVSLFIFFKFHRSFTELGVMLRNTYITLLSIFKREVTIYVILIINSYEIIIIINKNMVRGVTLQSFF